MRINARRTRRYVPELVRWARAAHPKWGRVQLRTAVVMAWVGLAGVVGWTPAMVAVVERELGE